MKARQLKPKTCRICKQEFTPYSSTSVVCGLKCAIDLQETRKKRQLDRDLRDYRRRERKKRREAKERLKTRSDWLREAQTAFNAYIRERDRGQMCISCQKPPKKKNCGHYKSVGSSPELRFHPFNANLQCESCNSWKSGAIDLYRPNLVKKIGESNVLFLEGPHQPQKWTIDDIKEIKDYYKQQLKLLKAGES